MMRSGHIDARFELLINPRPFVLHYTVVVIEVEVMVEKNPFSCQYSPLMGMS